MSERNPAANGSGTTDTAGGTSAGDQAQAAVTASQGMQAAAGGLESLAGTLRDKSQSMSGQGPTGTVQQAAAVAADKLEGAAQVLRQTDPEQLVTELEALVRRKPLESVLVAVGLGYLLSKVIR